MSGLWFFLIGWWVFFLPKTHVDGWIPMSGTSLQRLKRNRRRALAVFGVSLVGAFGAWVLGAPFVALAFAVVAIPSVFLAVNTPGSIGATLQADVRWVVLEPVHPRFAQAYEEGRRSATSAG